MGWDRVWLPLALVPSLASSKFLRDQLTDTMPSLQRAVFCWLLFGTP